MFTTIYHNWIEFAMFNHAIQHGKHNLPSFRWTQPATVADRSENLINFGDKPPMTSFKERNITMTKTADEKHVFKCLTNRRVLICFDQVVWKIQKKSQRVRSPFCCLSKFFASKEDPKNSLTGGKPMFSKPRPTGQRAKTQQRPWRPGNDAPETDGLRSNVMWDQPNTKVGKKSLCQIYKYTAAASINKLKYHGWKIISCFDLDQLWDGSTSKDGGKLPKIDSAPCKSSKGLRQIAESAVLGLTSAPVFSAEINKRESTKSFLKLKVVYQSIWLYSSNWWMDKTIESLMVVVTHGSWRSYPSYFCAYEHRLWYRWILSNWLVKASFKASLGPLKAGPKKLSTLKANGWGAATCAAYVILGKWRNIQLENCISSSSWQCTAKYFQANQSWRWWNEFACWFLATTSYEIHHFTVMLSVEKKEGFETERVVWNHQANKI